MSDSALIIAARFHNIPKKLKDIVNIVHIQETTLRKRLTTIRQLRFIGNLYCVNKTNNFFQIN